MGTTLQETPSGNRLHIGIFGKTNSGKSAFINAFSGQSVSIVADVKGTTTDPVYKAMEIAPLGPCVLIDTAGFDDEGELGAMRMEKTALAAQKTELALIVFATEDMEKELEWFRYFQEKKTPVIPVVSKSDLRSDEENQEFAEKLREQTKEKVCIVSAKTGAGIAELKERMIRMVPEGFGDRTITGALVSEGDVVLLVMPQDIQAPKGRLILPQVQTMRELLDKKCIVLSATTDKLVEALDQLKNPPKLIITDSQSSTMSMITNLQKVCSPLSLSSSPTTKRSGLLQRGGQKTDEPLLRFPGPDRRMLHPCTTERRHRQRKDPADAEEKIRRNPESNRRKRHRLPQRPDLI